jgi:hypothetical protein
VDPNISLNGRLHSELPYRIATALRNEMYYCIRQSAPSFNITNTDLPTVDIYDNGCSKTYIKVRQPPKHGLKIKKPADPNADERATNRPQVP